MSLFLIFFPFHILFSPFAFLSHFFPPKSPNLLVSRPPFIYGFRFRRIHTHTHLYAFWYTRAFFCSSSVIRVFPLHVYYNNCVADSIASIHSTLRLDSILTRHSIVIFPSISFIRTFFSLYSSRASWFTVSLSRPQEAHKLARSSRFYFTSYGRLSRLDLYLVATTTSWYFTNVSRYPLRLRQDKPAIQSLNQGSDSDLWRDGVPNTTTVFFFSFLSAAGVRFLYFFCTRACSHFLVYTESRTATPDK